MATNIQEILSKEGYNIEGMDNRNRSVKNINSVLKNSDIIIKVCKNGMKWTGSDNKPYNVKITLPSVGSARFYFKSIDPSGILTVLGKFLRMDEVKEKLYSETEEPCTCGKCEGAGVIPAFYFYADGVCFDCMGLGIVSNLMIKNVQDKAKRELSGWPFINKFRVTANYAEKFPIGVERIKAIDFIGHETAEEWLSKKDGIFYIHQPICMGNGWFAIPESEFSKFAIEYNKKTNKSL
jgi:galactitol-specific phosphotransferase system IIB component